MSKRREAGRRRMEWALLGFPILRPHRSAMVPVVAPLAVRHGWAVEVIATDGAARLATDARTGAALVWDACERSHACIHARIVGGRGGARVVPVLAMEPVRLPPIKGNHGSTRMGTDGKKKGGPASRRLRRDKQ